MLTATAASRCFKEPKAETRLLLERDQMTERQMSQQRQVSVAECHANNNWLKPQIALSGGQSGSLFNTNPLSLSLCPSSIVTSCPSLGTQEDNELQKPKGNYVLPRECEGLACVCGRTCVCERDLCVDCLDAGRGPVHDIMILFLKERVRIVQP